MTKDKWSISGQFEFTQITNHKSQKKIVGNHRLIKMKRFSSYVPHGHRDDSRIQHGNPYLKMMDGEKEDCQSSLFGAEIVWEIFDEKIKS